MSSKRQSSAFAQPATKEKRRIRACEVCGVSATAVTLAGLKNDRRREGPRYCLRHHPDSLNGRL
jgi:hypothetical protein